ncbi:Baculoviral IAP repeat-containing protein 7-A-like protein [Leptotrombidium deliense]|uniref:Baculoviral IAP repeat-containing protein 7-A-like protein n=1 Tax=Leptotrombidium deliense TaxID=299467 RepID=A0A443S3B2_9ACAR|nr:Baculoviral IAP repeat-containing protein 7-A-like protein [Leptotrombidium deliense]
MSVRTGEESRCAQQLCEDQDSMNRQTLNVTSVEEVYGSSEDQYRNFLRAMKYENVRLDSFRCGKWQISFINPEYLTKAGFFYLNYEDRVQCAFCNGIIEMWKHGDVPEIEHMQSYPCCEFMIGFNVGNKPIDDDPIQLCTGDNGSTAEFDVHGDDTKTTFHSNRNEESDVYFNSERFCLKFDVRGHKVAQNIRYIKYESRLKTFGK